MPPPANDLCSAATVIASLPHSETGLSSVDATTTAGETSAWAGDGSIAGATQMHRTMWWEYTPGSNQRVRFSITSATALAVAVYTGSCGALTEVASNRSFLTLDLTAGTTYRICVGRSIDGGGTFDFAAAVSTAPSNQLQSTAIDITGALPFDATIDLSLSVDRTEKSVYYKYTAAAGELMIGLFAYAATFGARVLVYQGPSNVFDDNEVIAFSGSNLALQAPLITGGEFIIKVTRLSGTAGSVDFSAVEAPSEPIPVGSIIDPDDTFGFPAAVISSTTGEILAFLDLPGGEWGDILENGVFMLDSADAADNVTLWNADYTLALDLGTLTPTGGNQTRIRISAVLQHFFAGREGGGGNDAKIYHFSDAGVELNAWTLPDAGLAALAPNSDGSIVYVGGQVSSTNTPIKRWLTAGAGSFGTDLVAGLGANERVWDMLVLSDDTVIVSWLNTSTGTVTVKRFEDDGTLLGTLTKTGMAKFFTRLAFDYLTYESFFWMWTHATDGFSVWERVEAASMTVDYTVPNVREYESGQYTGAVTATPDARFGASQSCPFFFSRVALGDEDVTIPPGTPGPYVWVHIPLRSA
jgi:hypothetical protein